MRFTWKGVLGGFLIGLGIGILYSYVVLSQVGEIFGSVYMVIKGLSSITGANTTQLDLTYLSFKTYTGKHFVGGILSTLIGVALLAYDLALARQSPNVQG